MYAYLEPVRIVDVYQHSRCPTVDIRAVIVEREPSFGTEETAFKNMGRAVITRMEIRRCRRNSQRAASLPFAFARVTG